MFIQRDNHGRGDRSTRRVLNRRREEIRSNEKKWSRRRIVNTGANRLGTKKTYSSKDTRRVSEYSQRERSSLDEGEPFSLQTRARIPPFSRLLRFLQPSPVKRETIAILLSVRVFSSDLARIARFNDLQKSIPPVFVHRVYHRFAPIGRSEELDSN